MLAEDLIYWTCLEFIENFLASFLVDFKFSIVINQLNYFPFQSIVLNILTGACCTSSKNNLNFQNHNLI